MFIDLSDDEDFEYIMEIVLEICDIDIGDDIFFVFDYVLEIF